jgi:hypothetical protein
MNLAALGKGFGRAATSADFVGRSKYSNEVYFLLL